MALVTAVLLGVSGVALSAPVPLPGVEAALPVPAPAPGAPVTAAEALVPLAPGVAGAAPMAPTAEPGAAGGPAAVAAPEGPEAAAEAPSKAYDRPLRSMRERAPLPEHAAEPEGMPSRESMDRYVEQRRQEVDAQLRALDPWGQYRRDWREGRRQFRRDLLDHYRAVPGFGAYPWGPVAPYYGAPWGELTAPVAPSREGVDAYFERQHRAFEQQLPGGARWSPYEGGPYRGRGDWAQEEQARRLRQNPWAPAGGE
jgi:hypothetical protein